MLQHFWRRPERLRAQDWRMWLLARARPLGFAVAMGLVLIYLLLFGENG